MESIVRTHYTFELKTSFENYKHEGVCIYVAHMLVIFYLHLQYKLEI